MSVDVHPSAIVARGAELGDGVRVGPYCCIDSRVVIGEGTVLNAFVTVHDGVTVGRNCHVYEYTALGGDPQDHSYRGEASRVRIGDDNVIRENVTVNRATGEDNETVVGNGCLIMEGVHLAHNVHVGNAVTIANTWRAMLIDVETRSPVLSNVSGGMSGPAVKPQTLFLVWQASAATTLPIIASGGVARWQDAVEYFLAGASMVQVGSANFQNPAAMVQIVDGIDRYLAEHGHRALSEIRGLAHQRRGNS